MRSLLRWYGRTTYPQLAGIVGFGIVLILAAAVAGGAIETETGLYKAAAECSAHTVEARR